MTSVVAPVKKTNAHIHETVEFDHWAYSRDLLAEEEAAIERYLSRTGKTLEGGTGGGRIVLEMQRLGFTDLTGFDIVPALIEQARINDSTGSIRFRVQDALHVDEPDEAYDQLVYLQQLISVISDRDDRLRALREAYRVLRPGGVALFSVLCFAGRARRARYWPYLTYLSLLRRLRRSRRPMQSLPWLMLGGRLNLWCLVDAGPYVYWYHAAEFEQELVDAGFEVAQIGSSRQALADTMERSASALQDREAMGALYVVCRKPLSTSAGDGHGNE